MLATGAILISALAFYFCTGFNHIWFAAWIAPVPILLLAFRRSARLVLIAAFLAYLLGILHIAQYLHVVLGWTLAILMPILMACAFAACVLFARTASMRLPSFVAVWAFPVAWTSYEFLIALVSPHGTFFNYAYSQMDALPVIQIASITGIWGISFTLMLWSSMFAMWRKPALLALIWLVPVLAFGLAQIKRHDNQSVAVGFIAADANRVVSWGTQDPQKAVAIANAWSNRIATVAAQGARVIVLPEKFLGITPQDRHQVYSIFSNAARKTQTTVVAGFNFIGIDPPRNIAVVFARDGGVLLTYDKHHMLQGPETGYLVGQQPAFFYAAGYKWGVEICKDLDFPAWSRQYGKNHIRFLAVPAWDFVMDAWLHDRMAIMRGVENGFTLVRTAQQGLLTVSDASGRVLAERESFSAPDVMFAQNVPPGPGATLYSRFGDWFGWINVLALIALMAARYTFKNRHSGVTSPPSR